MTNENDEKLEKLVRFIVRRCSSKIMDSKRIPIGEYQMMCNVKDDHVPYWNIIYTYIFKDDIRIFYGSYYVDHGTESSLSIDIKEGYEEELINLADKVLK